MPYEAEYWQLDDYVRVSIRGTRVEAWVPADSSIVVDRTLELVNESGLDRCLVVVANNRAFPLRVFGDEEDALAWLLADS